MLTPPLPPGREIDLPGRGRTFVRELAGPPGAPVLLLLHGLAATADLNWFRAYEPLGREFRVLAVDHRGHGRGVRSSRRFRLADCADDAAAVCAQLGVDRVVPVGYSMGGPIAQLMWHRHRPIVAGLVLAATSRHFRGQPRTLFAYSALPAVSAAARLVPSPVWRRVGDELFGRRFAGTPFGDWAASELERTNPVAVVEAATALTRYSSHDWLAGVDVPVAVIVTTLDRLVPPHRQRRMAELVPGARVFEVRGDHLACVNLPSVFVPTLVDACRYVTR